MPKAKSPTTPTGRKAWQRYLAEAIGTFAVVFGACGAVISDTFSGGAVTLLGIALVPGLVVIAMIYALGPVSAAHFNPAVTLAFALTRRFPWRHVPQYLLAQLVGALAASLSHALLYGQEVALKANFGAHIPAAGLAWGSAFGFELIFGFLLMFVIAGVATDKRVGGPIPGLAIGLTVALAIMFGGPLSGASMNPIRSLAPALFAGGAALQALPIYLVAPTLGAIGAVFVYDLLRDGPEHAQSAPADFG
jgi:MIP family channel proteins